MEHAFHREIAWSIEISLVFLQNIFAGKRDKVIGGGAEGNGDLIA